jgi:hypothetical protein
MKYSVGQITWYVDADLCIIKVYVTGAKLNEFREPVYHICMIEHTTTSSTVRKSPLSYILSMEWSREDIAEEDIYESIVKAKEYVDDALQTREEIENMIAIRIDSPGI